ncbi:unnamed protein product [Phaedon cochleariae]|uniref:FHA domain-containing protein n=1 Tax=Phaedon cochleariae TaxID=80249 RepID=A0A9P0DS22_PHACE|nr:unnamed protein product [Phaedon cochleariae]
MARSSESTDYSSEMYGSLLIYRNDGEKGPIYDLSEGTTTIGASTDADIRLKIKDIRLEDIHCLLQVNTNGIAVIFNKSIAAPVTINGDPLVYSKNRVLKHEDYFEVLGKKFQYFNDNISEKDYQRSLTAIRKSVAPVLQTKTISTKIPVHQRVLIANERDKITDYVTPEKCPNRRSGTDGSKTTSKLVVSKALSKLPKSSRRLSLNLTPRVLSSRRMSLPKKKCGGCADLIDFSSPRKSILKRNSKKLSEINDLPDENYLTSEEETPGSGLRSSRSVGRSSISNIPADSNNSKEKTPRNISTSSRSIERSSPNERTLSVDLEEITPESSKRFSRSMDRSSTNRTSKVAYTNELTLPLDGTTPETSGRYSRNIDSSSAKKTKALDENTPETNKRLTRKTHSVSNMNDMTLPLDESTPAHSQRYSRNNVSSSTKRTASTIDDTLEDNDSTLPLDEKSPKADMSSLRVEERFSEQKQTVDIHEENDMIMFLETKIQGNSRRSSRSLVRSPGANRISSVSNLPGKNEVTSGTSHIFSKNIESSPAKRRASSIGYLQKESVFSLKEKTPDIKSRSSGNSRRSSSDTGKTFSKNIDRFSYKKRTSSVSNLPEKNNLTPGTNQRHSINITSSPAERNNISIGDDQTSDFEAETKRRYSINLQNSSGRTASSLGNHLDEEKTPETNYRSLRNTGSSSAKRTATSIGNLTGEETPETSKGLSVKINGSSSKRISSIDNETDSSRCLDSKLKNTQKLFENNAHNVKRKIYSVGNIHHDTLNLRYSLKEKTKSMMEFGYHSDTQDAPRRSVRKSSKLDGSYEVSVFSGLMETDSQILNSKEDHTENINKLNLRFSLGGHTTKSSVNSRISSRSKAHSLGGLMVEANYQRKNKSTAAIRSSDRRNTRSVYNSEDYLSIESGIPAQSRTGRSLARNTYSHEDVEDDLENEVFESPVDKRKSSLRRVSSMSSTSGISEIDIDSEPDQSTQSTNIKSSAGRSSRRNTYSVLDYTDNQRNKMIESPVEILNRKSTSSSRNCSFIEISEDDLENSNADQESYRRTSFRRSSRRNASSVEESEGDFENEDEPPESMNRKSSISGTPSLIEISEDDLDNGSVHESRRRSWNRRSSSRRNTSSGVSENRADKKGQSLVMSVNRKSSLGRNSSVLEISEDDLESSNTDQGSNRRTSVRSSLRRHSSLMKKSEGDLEIADEPTLIRKSSVDRSSSRRYGSTSEHSEGHANEKDQSPLKAANRRSFVRSSLKNESLIEKHSIQDLENEMNESPAGTMNKKSRSSRRNSSGDDLDNSDTDQESNRRISVRYSSLNKESEVDFKNVQEFLRGSSGGRSLRSRYSTEHSENQDEKEQSTLKAVNRKSVSRSSLKNESLVDRHSVQDYQENLGTEINESSSGTIDRKSASSSRNSSLIEMSEDDLDSSNTDQESNRRNSVRTSLRKTYYLMIESEGDLDNADDSTVQVFIRNSSVGRSSSRRNTSISEHSEDLANRIAQSPVKTVNRISVVKSPLKNESPAEAMNRKLSLSRNSSENSTIQESNKITSVRRSSRRDLSLMKESEVDLEHEDEPTVQTLTKKSPVGRSSIGKTTFSTEHSEDRTNERDQSPLHAANKKSVARSSLKNKSLVDAHSIQDPQENLGNEMDESPVGTVNRKSSLSRNISLNEKSEDDLDNCTDQESSRRTSVRSSGRNSTLNESGDNLENEIESAVTEFIRRSSVDRSGNTKYQSPVKAVNRKSAVRSSLKNESPAEAMNRKSSLSRNSSLVDVSENSTLDQDHIKRTSVRRSSSRDSSLMKESEVNLENEDKPTVQAFTRRSSVGRSSMGRNTSSTDHSEDRTNEILKTASRKSVARSSLKNKYVVDAHSIQDPQENLGNEMDNRKSSLSRNISLNEKSEDDLDNCTDQESSRRTSVRSSGRNSSVVNESGDNLENEVESAVTEFIRRSSVDRSGNTKYQSPVKAVNRKSAVRSSLKNESPAEAINRKSSLSRNSSLVDVSENSTLDQDHIRRTSVRRSSSKDSSLMKESEVDLENEDKPTVQAFTRRSSVSRSSIGRNTSSTDHSEDRTNEILKTATRKSVARSSLKNKYVVDAHSIQDPQENLGNEMDESPVGTVNRKSSSLHSNSSLNEKSEDDLDNSMDQETSRRTSVRASKRNSSLVKESGDNFENEVEPTVEEFIRRSSGGRSRNTSSTEHSEDHGREEGRSPSKSVERKSVGRSSLKNESLLERSEAELANVSNRSTHSRTSRSSSRIRDSSFEEVDLATPKSSAKKQRSNVLPYAPKTEVITPTTPDGIKSDDAGFKTPLNTPGLFNEIKKSMLKSRSKLQKSSSNLLEEFNKDTGLKRPRESVGDSGRSTKKMRLIINEDDTFEESHTFESDASPEESYDNIVENDTDDNFHSDNGILEKSRLKSPKSDLREVKNKSASHKLVKSPKNDLRNIVGVKKLFSTPRNAKSPRNDLTNVPNLRKIMSPKSQNSPANDLTDVRGLKRLMKTPKVTKAPLNDLSDINMEGVSKMFHVSGVHRLSTSSDIENNEDLFDRLFDKRPARTYRGTSASPRGKSMDAYGGDRRKTMGDRGDSKSSPRVLDWVEEQKVIRMDRARKMTESEEKKPTKVEEKSETPISHPTRSRRNVSAETVSKESETGIVDSPLALTRGRRNVKKVKVSPPPKVTRSRRKAKEAPIISEEKLQLSELDETDTSIVASEKNATFDEIQQPNMEANKKAPKRQNTRAQTKVVETSEDVTFSDISTASVGEEPKKRGRRAANKKEVLEETPKQTTRGAKKVKAIEKAEKPPAESSRTRQRTAKVAQTEDIEQEPEEKKPAGVVEISVETFSDNSTAGSGEGPKNRGRIVATKKEVQDETPKKVTRGAKKVKAIEEADKPPPPESPRTRKRTAKVAQSEEIDQVPEEKKPVRRGRNEDEIVKKVSQRKGKGAKIDIEMKAELEEETIVKRRGRLATVAQNEGKPEDLDTKDSKGEEEVVPRRPKRGRKASVDEIPKEKIEEVPPPKRGRRGKATPVETATEVQIQSEMKQEKEADKEKEPIVEKPAKGRGRTIKVVENKDAKEEENVEVSVKEEDKAVPKRGRRGRKASVDDIVKEKVEEVVPAKRGKRGKAAISVEVEKELVSLEPEVQTEVEKSLRGRSRSKKAVVEEENIDTVSPVKKRPQRNNKSKEIEQEPEVVAKKTTRSKGNVAEKMGKNEMDESLTSKQTRAVRANKKNLDISAEAEATGRRKKHVQFKI